MSFSTQVKENALVACARHCSLCHRFAGLKMEVHHITQKSEGGTDDFDNAIPLCLDCHADMRSYDHKHPKGTKYTPTELKRHRDEWYKRVQGWPVALYDARSRDLDLSVFKQIKALIPWTGAISFIRTNSFAGFAFRRPNMEQLDEFLNACGNPSFEFIDPELEALRATLRDEADEFANAISEECYYLEGRSHLMSVPQEWEHTQPKRFSNAVKRIHGAAAKTVDAYDTLMRSARRKLGD